MRITTFLFCHSWSLRVSMRLQNNVTLTIHYKFSCTARCSIFICRAAFILPFVHGTCFADLQGNKVTICKEIEPSTSLYLVSIYEPLDVRKGISCNAATKFRGLTDAHFNIFEFFCKLGLR